MKHFIASILLSAIFAVTAFAQEKSKYCNARFSYCIEYPKELLGQGESNNGDGQKFIRKDKKASLAVYNDTREVIYENVSQTKSECFKQDSQSKDGKKVTYKKQGENFYVVSGTKGNKLFYQKTIFSDAMVTAYLEYDQSLSGTYNDYCAYLFKTFK